MIGNAYLRIMSGLTVIREQRGSVELYEAQMNALAILGQPGKRAVVQISESRPGYFASICRPRSANNDPLFAKLIRGSWFAKVVVMSESQP
jgi:hypothetical protein